MRKLKRIFAFALATMVAVTSVNLPAFASEQITVETATDSAIAVEEVISKEQELFNDALEKNGVVTFEEDTVLEGEINLSLPEGQEKAEVVLDLKGNTLSEKEVAVMFNIDKNVVLTIKDGNIVSDEKNGIVINSNGKVILDNVSILASGEDSVAIVNNSESGAGGVTIFSASVQGTMYAIARMEGTLKKESSEKENSGENYEVGNKSEVTTAEENKVIVETKAALTVEEIVVETAASITVESNSGNNSQNIPVEETQPKSSEVSTQVNPTASVNVEVLNYNTLIISWDEVEGATNYDLYRADDGVNFKVISANNTAGTYTDNNLTPGKVYSYKVKTRRIVGPKEYMSDFSVVKTGNTVLAQPVGLGTVNVNATTVNVTWNAVLGTNTYAVYRSKSPEADYAQIGIANTTAFEDNTVTPGVTYYYKVAATSDTYVGPLSTYAEAKTKLSKASKLKAVSNGYNSIALTWKAAEGATQYEIYRSTKKSSGYKKIATVSGESYTAKGLKINKTYYFKIKAKSGEFTSSFSNRAKAKTQLSSVTDLKAKVTRYDRVKLTWTKVKGAKKYEIYRSTSKNSGYKVIGTTTKNSYTNKKLENGKTYYYKIKVVRGKYKSDYSNMVKAKPVPAATTLEATSTNYDSVKLTWKKVTGAEKYVIYRSTKEKKGYKKIKTLTELEYADSGLTTGKTYYYKVYALRGNVKGTPAMKAVKPVTNAPASFEGDSITRTAIQLTWEQPEGAVSYVIYRSVDNNNFTEIGKTTKLKYIDEGLTFGKQYYYKVAAVRNNTIGKFTDVLPLVATIPGVDNLKIKCTSIEEREIKLSWDKPDEYTNFEIYRSTDENTGFTHYATVTKNSYKDEISDGNVYYYRVYATLNGLKSNYKQTEYGFASKIKLNKSKKTLKAGENFTLEATFTPEATTDKTLTWSTSDAAVATVANGVVTAVAAGKATITATTINGKTATCTITVKGSTNVVVVLDPGHGGYDPGNVASGYYEKNLNLKIAQYCKAELEKYSGITVYMTRDSDTYVSVDGRPAAAKEKDANMLVSFHMNSSASSSAKGAEIYYSLNAGYSDATSKLATSIQTQLVGLGLNNRGVKTRQGDNGDYYGVIRGSVSRGFGAVLIEHAFMSNADDINFFNSEAKLQSLGVADATGIANYYGLKKK